MSRIDITYPGDTITRSITALVRQPVSPTTAPPIDIGLVQISTPAEQIPGPPGPPGPGVVISDTPPPNPKNGTQWWESDTGILWAWYIDDDSAQWVQISGGVGTPSATYILTPQMFGAAGDGVTNDFAAIQAAVDSLGADGGCIWFPPGDYLVNQTITVANPGIAFRGAGTSAVTITQSDLDAAIVSITSAAPYFTLDTMTFRYSGTPTTTALAAIVSKGGFCSFNNFVINNAWTGMLVADGAGQYLSNFIIRDYENCGILIQNIGDVMLSQFIMDCGTLTRGAIGGIRMQDHCEAIVVVNGDILNGVYSMTTDASVNGIGTRPAYNSFYAVYFDSSARGSLVSAMVQTDFTGCWFSAGRSGGGYPGLTIGACDSVRFVGTRFFNCGGHGCQVNATAKRISFTDCSFDSNSATSGAGVSHGLLIQPNTTDWSVIGGSAGNNNGTADQAYGIFVDSGASDRYSIIGVNLMNNATGALIDSGTGSTKHIHSNIGVPTNTMAGGLLNYAADAIPVGGTTGMGYRLSSTSNFGVFFGSGAPSLSAAKGSLYLRSDGTSNVSRMYVNTNGSTTWTAVNTVA